MAGVCISSYVRDFIFFDSLIVPVLGLNVSYLNVIEHLIDMC